MSSIYSAVNGVSAVSSNRTTSKHKNAYTTILVFNSSSQTPFLCFIDTTHTYVFVTDGLSFVVTDFDTAAAVGAIIAGVVEEGVEEVVGAARVYKT